MIVSRRTSILLVLLAAALTACGGDAWKDLTKVGNTWEYEGETTKAKVTAKVLGTWSIGETVYAEIAPDFGRYTNVTELCSWNKDSKTFLHAGESSRFNDKTRQFFVKETVIGAVEGKANTAFTNSDATVLRYLGEETIKVPAGEYTAYKFSRINTRRKINEIWWYADKVGIVRVKNSKDTFGLVKYTEGKEQDPKAMGATVEGVAFVKKFFAAAKKGEMQGVKSLFAGGAGQQDFASQAPEITLLVDRIKSGVRDDQATWSYLGAKTYGLRFLKYDESGTEPNVWKVDAVMELTNQGGQLMIKKIGIANNKLIN